MKINFSRKFRGRFWNLDGINLDKPVDCAVMTVFSFCFVCQSRPSNIWTVSKLDAQYPAKFGTRVGRLIEPGRWGNLIFQQRVE